MNEITNLPLAFAWQLRLIVDWIPELDLVGIESIRLLSKIPEGSSNPPAWYTRAQENNFVISGAYLKKSTSNLPSILLFVDDVLRPLPKVGYIWPILTLYLARIVAHEVAHHLIEERGYVFAPGERYPSDAYKEEMADRYAFYLVEKMKRRIYYRAAARATKYISYIYFLRGGEEWKKDRFDLSAEYWYKSWMLDSERIEATSWYWRSRERATEKN